MCEFYTISKKDNKWISEPMKELNDFSTIPGVWFVFGKKTSDDKFICLDVAETSDIKDEMSTDISYSKMDLNELEKKYGTGYHAKNKFSECMFKCNYNHFRKFLWSHAKTDYPDLRFIIINMEINDKNTRRDLERFIAFKFNAIYWRDGRRYENVDDKRKRLITDTYCKSFEENNQDYNGLDTAIKSLVK